MFAWMQNKRRIGIVLISAVDTAYYNISINMLYSLKYLNTFFLYLGTRFPQIDCVSFFKKIYQNTQTISLGRRE
jgi:hypothetical protein